MTGVASILLSVAVQGFDFYEGAEPLLTIDHLADCLKIQQDQLRVIAPPSDDRYVHSDRMVRPVRWNKFPKAFKAGMLAEIDDHGFPLYCVGIIEDVQTRETVFLNGMGVEIFRLPPVAGYNSHAFQMSRLGISSLAEFSPYYDWWLDPSKIAAQFVLISNRFMRTIKRCRKRRLR